MAWKENGVNLYKLLGKKREERNDKLSVLVSLSTSSYMINTQNKQSVHLPYLGGEHVHIPN